MINCGENSRDDGEKRISAMSSDGAEKAVFEEFAPSAGLNVVPGSIESRQPPDPDIRCELVGEGPVAFEVTESLDGGRVAKRDADAEKCGQEIVQAFKALPRQAADGLRRLLGNAVVDVEFDPGAHLKDKKASLSGLLQRLRDIPPSFSGRLSPPEFRWPAPVLSIQVGRLCSSCGPIFSVDAGGAYYDVTIGAIRAKFAKRYSTDAPIELLVYFDRQHVLPASVWLPSVLAFLQENVNGSLFRRAWIFDRKSKAVIDSFSRP
jgi:hypothetical protein